MRAGDLVAVVAILGASYALWRVTSAPQAPQQQAYDPSVWEFTGDPWGSDYEPTTYDLDDASVTAEAIEAPASSFGVLESYALPIVYRASGAWQQTFGGNYMRISLAGIDAIRRHEALRLDPYKDIAGHWTVGYGHKLLPHESIERITEQQAIAYLTEDVGTAEDAVNALVKVPVTQPQFDALVSLTYNIGAGAFGRSTLLKRLNAGDYAAAQQQFLVWNKARINGVLQPSRGLTNRRVAEAELFGSTFA